MILAGKSNLQLVPQPRRTCWQIRCVQACSELAGVACGRTPGPDASKIAEAAKYRGVSYKMQTGFFVSKVRVRGRMYYLGSHDSAAQAAQAFDCKLRAECAGDKLRLRRSLNFPTESERTFTESPFEARLRGLKIWGGGFQKELKAFERLKKTFARSAYANGLEIQRLSDSSRADALLTHKAGPCTGLLLQLKAASSRGCEGRVYQFAHLGGYHGMLMVFVALDRDLVWAAAGQHMTRQQLTITVGGCHDKCFRVADIGRHLVKCYYDRHAFPHVSMSDAVLQCSAAHKVEAAAHTQLRCLFSGINLRLTRPKLHNSTVDSVLEVYDAGGTTVCLQLQEKASNQHRRGTYHVQLGKRGGALGRIAYDAHDFDGLAACIMDKNRLQGVFLIPMSALVSLGFVGQKPMFMTLYPPWRLPNWQATKLKYSWQPDFFVDLRDWQGSAELPRALRERLSKLSQQMLELKCPGW